MQKEQEMRESEGIWPKSIKELNKYIKSLESTNHDYGTCVYAVSLASVATFRYMAHKLGITGFQASCADLDVIRRTRHMEHGFSITNYSNLLYPQFLDSNHFPSLTDLLENNKKMLAEEAREELKNHRGLISPKVKAWWQFLSTLDTDD